MASTSASPTDSLDENAINDGITTCVFWCSDLMDFTFQDVLMQAVEFFAQIGVKTLKDECGSLHGLIKAWKQMRIRHRLDAIDPDKEDFRSRTRATQTLSRSMRAIRATAAQ